MASQQERGYHVVIQDHATNFIYYDFCYLFPGPWRAYWDDMEAHHAQHDFIRQNCPEYDRGYYGEPDCTFSAYEQEAQRQEHVRKNAQGERLCNACERVAEGRCVCCGTAACWWHLWHPTTRGTCYMCDAPACCVQPVNVAQPQPDDFDPFLD